jgi:lipopolysaccharide transport system ATP-binding protein/teichoic acid transport system ATP-binding protein
MRLGRAERKLRLTHALREVSFEVPQGEVLGVIGANGAGKSTLLRTMAGIIPPTSGRIEVRGRLSTLLALGVGFKKELSGRENVLLGGLAAGKELADIRAEYDDIAAFAGLGDFMDLPMRTYSSGMYARLAFAVAAFMNPDILLVDEALSTGDAAFKQRSMDKMAELRAHAGTIVLVTHSLSTIRQLASDCLWLDKGQVMARGEPADVTRQYLEFAQAQQGSAVGAA